MLSAEAQGTPEPGRLTRPVVLIGFMGAGKTKVGRIVAQYFGCGFVDTDQMVEQRAGKRVSEIFAEAGEEQFRRMEAEAIGVAIREHGGIIAVGGGAATFEGNWATLRDSDALTIYLQASPRTILTRVADKGTRPLLAGLDHEQMLEKITRMLEERDPWYRRADVTLSTDNSLDKYGMADVVIEHLKRVGIGISADIPPR